MIVVLRSINVSDEQREALRYFLRRRGLATRAEVRGILMQLRDAWFDDLVARHRTASLCGMPPGDGTEPFPQFREWIESGGEGDG